MVAVDWIPNHPLVRPRQLIRAQAVPHVPMVGLVMGLVMVVVPLGMAAAEVASKALLTNKSYDLTYGFEC